MSDCIRLAARRYDTNDFRVRSKLAVHFCFAAHALDTRANPQGSNFKRERVTGDHGPPEASFFDAGKQHEFLIAIIDLAKGKHCSYLGQRFDYQHARHDGRAGKMALKEQLVDTHLLDADDSFAWDEFDDAIYQQEGITVRQ